MDETSRGGITVTPGLLNVVGRSRMSDRACSACGFGFPIYTGRYPGKCPKCGGAVTRAVNESGTVRAAMAVHRQFPEILLPRLVPWVDDVEHGRTPGDAPPQVVRAIEKAVAQFVAETESLPVVAVSRVPRLQALIEAGDERDARDASSSCVRALPFSAVETVGGQDAVKNLRLFLEGPVDVGEPFERYFRLESPTEPVLVFEFDTKAESLVIFATERPESVLGFDPRADLIAEPLAESLWSLAPHVVQARLADLLSAMGHYVDWRPFADVCVKHFDTVAPSGAKMDRKAWVSLLSGAFDRVAQAHIAAKVAVQIEHSYMRPWGGGTVPTAADLHEEIITPPNSLGIPRAEMPQIDDDQMPAFLDWVRERGIAVIPTPATARLLLPTQGELDTDKVDKFKSAPRDVLTKRVVTSKDDRILDGHHRWAALIELDPDANLETIQVQLPITELLALAREFAGARFRKAEESVIEGEMPRPDEVMALVLKKLHAIMPTRKFTSAGTGVSFASWSGRFDGDDGSRVVVRVQRLGRWHVTIDLEPPVAPGATRALPSVTIRRYEGDTVQGALTESATDEGVLPGRPSNPADISFDPRCFIKVGTHTEFVVAPAQGSAGYPKRFSSEAEAENYAARFGRVVHREEVPTMRRVSWTCPREESMPVAKLAEDGFSPGTLEQTSESPGGKIMGPGGARGPTAGQGATRAHGGYRFEIGQARKTKVRRDVARSIQNRMNARRGLATRIAAAKKWHRSSQGRSYHRDLGRFNRRLEALEKIERTLAEDWTYNEVPRTADDVFDGILQKLIAIEATDVLQDVNFTDEGSVYLYFDPSLAEREVQEILLAVQQAQGADGARVVAMPKEDLDDQRLNLGIAGADEEPADWWVIFIPSAKGDAEGPDGAYLGASVPYQGAPAPAATMAVMGADPVANILKSLDIPKLLQLGEHTHSGLCCGAAESLAPTAAGPVFLFWAANEDRTPELRGIASAIGELPTLREAAARGVGTLFVVRAPGADEARAIVNSGRLTAAGPGVWTSLNDPTVIVKGR